MQITISVHSHLATEVIAEIHKVITAATFQDDMAPLSEHVLIHLKYGGENSEEHILARNENSVLVGYLHLDRTDEVSGPVVEIVVHPEFRNRNVGTQLVQFAKDQVQDRRLRLWAHGELAGANILAKKMGFTKARELWQMRRSLYAEIPKAITPTGTTIRKFNVGSDDENWLNLNAKVFSEHPEQGRLDKQAFEIRMRESWFKPEGFLVSQNSSGELTGFNWTKIHGSENTANKVIGHMALGEIYVIGVDPSQRGFGLGKALVLAGLDYLRAQGLAAAMLYVDSDNTSAIKLYESLGFSHWDTDVMFQA